MRVVEANAPSLDKKPAYGGKKEVGKDIFKKAKVGDTGEDVRTCWKRIRPCAKRLDKKSSHVGIMFCKPLRNYLFFSSSN